MKKEILLMALLVCIFSVSAVKVGVVVEFPDGEISTACIEVAEGTNAYTLLEKTNLDITWSYDNTWGHGLCGINDVGCPADNCWCSADYWGFYVRELSDSSWKYSSVGFDGGSSCDSHYCASSGDMLGFSYGPYGTKPSTYSFEEVCSTSQKRVRRSYHIIIQTLTPKKGDLIIMGVMDNLTSAGIRNAEIEIFTGIPGLSPQVFSGKTDKKGYLEFIAPDAGEYTFRVNVPGYNPPQSSFSLVIHESLTTTTLTVITTSTTTVRSPEVTTTTIRSPEVTTTLAEKIITTSSVMTTIPTTSTSLTPTTSTLLLPPIGQSINFPASGRFVLGGLLLFLSLWIFKFKKFKDK